MTRDELVSTSSGPIVQPRATWVTSTPRFRRWLSHHPDATPSHLVSSREADIFALGEGGAPAFVIKRWKYGLAADAEAQYTLLTSVQDAGLPVPAPAAWGRDHQELPLLATHYCGLPLAHPTTRQIRDAGGLLHSIHAIASLPGLPTSPGGPALIDDLIARHLPDIDEHPDIVRMLRHLQPDLRPPLIGLTHGDFHPGNLLFDGSHVTVADWSDAGIGDTRYDLAWAALLLWIYHGPAAYRTFLGAYAAAGGKVAGLAALESVAALRWLFLARTAPVPINREWMDAATAFLRDREATP